MRAFTRPGSGIHTLDRYLARIFFLNFAVLLFFLVTLLQLLDLFTHWSNIARANDPAWPALGRYVGMRFPELTIKFAPYATLLASLTTLSQLRRKSEIAAIRAAGLSCRLILLPLIGVCAIIALGHLVFQETVAIKASARLSSWQKNDFADAIRKDANFATDVWIADTMQIIKARQAERSSKGVAVHDLVIYSRGNDGGLDTSVKAERAIFQDGHWILENVTRFSVATGRIETVAVAPWSHAIDPSRFFSSEVGPEHTALPDLVRRIARADKNSITATQEKTVLYHRLAAPFASLLMPILGAIAGFGVYRQGDQILRLAFGLGFGVIYFVADNLTFAMGKTGAVPPIASALWPFALFLTCGLYVLYIIED